MVNTVISEKTNKQNGLQYSAFSKSRIPRKLSFSACLETGGLINVVHVQISYE